MAFISCLEIYLASLACCCSSKTTLVMSCFFPALFFGKVFLFLSFGDKFGKLF